MLAVLICLICTSVKAATWLVPMLATCDVVRPAKATLVSACTAEVPSLARSAVSMALT